MAKCLMCNQKKGKRFCHIVDGEICSLCCGTRRNEEECLGCQYYKSKLETRKYNKLPKFTTMEMEGSFELQAISDVVEQALCSVDLNEKMTLKDETAKYLIEKLLDVFYFNDKQVTFKDEAHENYFAYIYDAVESNIDLQEDMQNLIKVLGAIYFVLNRRTKGNREYFTVIHKYVGNEAGIRVL